METISFLLDFVLHIDVYLEQFVATYGVWVYLLLFAIVFTETGIVFMPVLPGDSLLFVAGALCGVGLLSFSLTVFLLILAAILGDQCNYHIGRWFGPKVFQWDNARFFNKKAFDQAHGFYEKYGGITIVLGRFLPFMRTFVPFVAGVAQMDHKKFSFYNVLGAFMWVLSIASLGYFLGNTPWAEANLEKIIWAMILLPGLLVLGPPLWKKWRPQAKT